MSKDNKITRREFVKRAAVAGTVVVSGSAAIIGGKAVLDEFSRTNELAQRNRERPHDGEHWFVPPEYKLVGALTALIVPSDKIGPGALEAGIVDRLDRLVAKSQKRQGFYASGLLGFDELARYEHGRTFAELRHKEQVHLLKLLDRIHLKMKIRGISVADKVWRKVTDLYYTWPAPGSWDGLGAAVDLFPRLVSDAFKTFYTSQVAWDWLGYDGPPFPRGYLGRVGECRAE